MGGGASKKKKANEAYAAEESAKSNAAAATGERRRSSLLAAQKKLSATSAMEDGDPGKAIEALTEAIRLSREAGDEDDSARGIYYTNRAECHYKMGDFKASANDCEEAVQLTPFMMRLWRQLGQARHQLGELLAAKQALENALKFDEGDAASKQSLEEVLAAMAAQGLEAPAAAPTVPAEATPEAAPEAA